jgi:hypothetical protein
MDLRLPDLIYPAGEVAFRFFLVARASALAKSATSDLLVDVPDTPAFGDRFMIG